MNQRFLGDALDHWKGSLFETLQKAELLRTFQVDPMATDAHRWKSKDWALLARLLRLEGSWRIVRHRRDLRKDRVRYFSEIPSDGDLFLDPDTGIMTGYVKRVEQCNYLHPRELLCLLQTNKRRIVVVFQAVRAQKTRARVEQVLKRLRRQNIPFCCVSYESATAAFLFFAHEKERVTAIRDWLQRFLGRHAGNRIGFWSAYA
jgi:hypothetical protein